MKNVIDDYRCTCGKLLFRGLILDGAVEIKCRFCHQVREIQGIKRAFADPTYAVFIVDRDGTVVRVTGSASQSVGYTHEEIVGKEIRSLIVMVAPEFFAALRDAIAAGETSVLFDSLYRAKDKSLRPVQVDAQGLTIGGEHFVVFSCREKRARHERFLAGGSLNPKP